MKRFLSMLLLSTVVLSMFSLAFVVAVPTTKAIDQGVLTDDLNRVGDVGFKESPSSADLPTRIGSLINIVLGILGVILVVIIVYAGFLWMTAGGEKDQVEKAKDWIKNAVIGLILILSAYAIANFVISKLILATT